MKNYNWHLFTPIPLSDPQYSSLLQRTRMQADLSQSELALLVGLARPSVSRIETCRRRVRPATAHNLAAAFGLSVKQLFAPIRSQSSNNRSRAQAAAPAPVLLPNPSADTTLALLTLLAYHNPPPTLAGWLVQIAPGVQERWGQLAPVFSELGAEPPTPADLWLWARQVPTETLAVFLSRVPTAPASKLMAIQTTLPKPGQQAELVLTACSELARWLTGAKKVPAREPQVVDLLRQIAAEPLTAVS